MKMNISYFGRVFLVDVAETGQIYILRCEDIHPHLYFYLPLLRGRYAP